MNQALKQRLVGALVLAALAIIFLPALFNGGRPRQSGSLMDVPPAPAVATFNIDEPVRPAGIPEDPVVPAKEWYAAEAEPGVAEKVQSAIKKTTSTGSLDSSGKSRAWVLQVAGFSDKAKAENLKKSLQVKGYRAFTRTLSRDKKLIVRVLIGPELDETALTKVKNTVDREFRVKSIITQFEP